MKNAQTKLLIAIVSIFTVGAIISGIVILGYSADAKRLEGLNEKMAAEIFKTEPVVSIALPTQSSQTDDSHTDGAPDEADDNSTVSVLTSHNSEGYLYKFLNLKHQYEDFVGWITIGENDEINLPVMQAEDNEYYLDRSYDGDENRYGAVFMDYLNDPTELSRNTFLYGHHYLGDDHIFAKLEKYHKEAYALENSAYYFATVKDEYECQIFASYLITPDSWRYYEVSFVDDEDFMDYVNSAIERSDVDYGVTVSAEDKIISLSTCDYTFDGARQLIHAKLVKKNG